MADFDSNSEIEGREISLTVFWVTYGQLDGDPFAYFIEEEEHTLIIPCPGEDSGTVIGSDIGTELFDMSNSDFGGNTEGGSSGSSVPTLPHNSSPTLKLGLDDLDDDCRDFVINQNVFNAIEELAGIHDPCTNRDAEQIIKDIFEDLCFEVSPMGSGLNITSSGPTEAGVDPQVDLSKHHISLGDFKSKFEGVETVDPSGLDGCRNLKCAYDLLKETLNPMYCETIGEFEGNEFIHLAFNIRSNTEMFRAGYTHVTKTPDYNSTIWIDLNDAYCDGHTVLEAAELILHESVHAHFGRWVWEAGYSEIPTEDIDAYKKFLSDVFLAKYGYSEPDDHMVMLNEMVDKIAQGLREFDNNRYPVDYYMFAVLESLEYTIGSSAISAKYGSNWKTHYKNLYDEMHAHYILNPLICN